MAEPAPTPAAGEPAAAPSKRARWVFLGLVAVYALTVAILAALGIFAFLWKTAVVPALFVAAALLGRLRGFIRDWAVFLGAVILFDSLRGLIYALINRYELPVYMVYAIDLERLLLFGTTAPEWLQANLLEPDRIGPFAKFLVVIHMSHFLFFLFFGLLIWLYRAAAFGAFKLAMVLLMYSGLVGYLVVPTVPPWMAANLFGVLPPIRHVTTQVYNASIPTLQASFDTNPIAAMPSLHSAFPALLAMIAVHHFGRRGIPMVVYALLVFLSITTLGEHYVVDVIAGVALAGLCYVAVYRWPVLDRLRRWWRARGEPGLRPRVLVMVLLVLLAEAAGLWARKFHWHYDPTVAFIERELEGRSPVAKFHRGRRAYRQGDFRLAQEQLAGSLETLFRPADARLAYLLLGRSAFENGDWEVAIDSLERFPVTRIDPRDGLILARALLRAGEIERGFATLDEIARVRSDNPRFLYWKTRLEYEHGRIGEEEYRARIAELEPRL